MFGIKLQATPSSVPEVPAPLSSIFCTSGHGYCILNFYLGAARNEDKLIPCPVTLGIPHWLIVLGTFILLSFKNISFLHWAENFAEYPISCMGMLLILGIRLQILNLACVKSVLSWICYCYQKKKSLSGMLRRGDMLGFAILALQILYY